MFVASHSFMDQKSGNWAVFTSVWFCFIDSPFLHFLSMEVLFS
uniref:Uncharacterized protein n=1 Tax=Rhizophora mucronata TaxID=61149 RepID=A0A2P2QH11_RHIMU